MHIRAKIVIIIKQLLNPLRRFEEPQKKEKEAPRAYATYAVASTWAALPGSVGAGSQNDPFLPPRGAAQADGVAVAKQE
jgi:hypothetical protein